jgi:hypothetical protein
VIGHALSTRSATVETPRLTARIPSGKMPSVEFTVSPNAKSAPEVRNLLLLRWASETR